MLHRLRGTIDLDALEHYVPSRAGSRVRSMERIVSVPFVPRTTSARAWYVGYMSMGTAGACDDLKQSSKTRWSQTTHYEETRDSHTCVALQIQCTTNAQTVKLIVSSNARSKIWGLNG